MIIPDDVREFASANGLERSLPAVLTAATCLQPDVSEVSCILEYDAETEVNHIVVLVSGFDPDAPQTLDVYEAWHRRLLAIVGSVNICLFQLELVRPS